MKICNFSLEGPKVTEVWNGTSENFFCSLRSKLLHTMKDGLSAVSSSVLNDLLISTNT